MAERGIALEAAAIVVLGQFNPAIISPLWFKDEALIGLVEFEDQQVELISRDVTVFRVGWLQVNVNRNSLQLSTTQIEEFERLRDAMTGVLKSLSHTPISAMGINRTYHSEMKSIADLNAVGDAITPKAVWEGTLELAGMRSVTLWGARPDKYAGRIQIQVEPSTQVPQAIFVAVNDHYSLTLAEHAADNRDTAWELKDADVRADSKKIETATRILSEEWQASLARAEAARGKIVHFGGAGK